VQAADQRSWLARKVAVHEIVSEGGFRIVKRSLWVVFCLVLVVVASGWARLIEQPAWPLRVKTIEVVPGVKITYLEDQNSTPFPWNADTCWFPTFKVSDADAVHYLEGRAGRGITVVQCTLLPWTREGDDNWFGVKPFVDNRFDQPNEKYWGHVDNVVQAATGIWIDPHNASQSVIDGSPLPNQGTRRFRPPDRNRFGDSDWVLVLEADPG
jgi:hypothetical protein